MKRDPTCASMDGLRDTLTKDEITRNFLQYRWLDDARGNSKFDMALPKAMREKEIDMWIVMVKRGHRDPLHHDLGGGSPNNK